MDRHALEQMARNLTDKGKLIEAGWIGLRIAAIPADAPQAQLDEMRNAFMAGANHLFFSIMQILDPGEDETPGDLRRMAMIEGELNSFGEELKLRLHKGPKQ